MHVFIVYASLGTHVETLPFHRLFYHRAADPSWSLCSISKITLRIAIARKATKSLLNLGVWLLTKTQSLWGPTLTYESLLEPIRDLVDCDLYKSALKSGHAVPTTSLVTVPLGRDPRREREEHIESGYTQPRSPNVSSQQSQHNTTTEQISHHSLLLATLHSCYRSSHTFITRPCSAWTTEGFSHPLSQESSFILPGQHHHSTGYEEGRDPASFRRGILHISLVASEGDTSQAFLPCLLQA